MRIIETGFAVPGTSRKRVLSTFMMNEIRTLTLTSFGALTFLLCYAASLPLLRAQAGDPNEVPFVTATTKGPNQINLIWPAVSNSGYGYLVEIQSLDDPRYLVWTELRPIPAGTVYTCDNKVLFNGGTCNINDPSGTHVYNPPTNRIPYWVTDDTYIDAQDGSPAQFIVSGLRPNTLYNFRVRTQLSNSQPTPEGSDQPYSDTATATTSNYTLRYVSPNGNDANDGTSADTSGAWRTLFHAAAAIDCGQALIVMGGSYPADGIFMNQVCTPDNKAVVLVNPGDTAVITSSVGPGAPTIALAGTSLVVDGIISVSSMPQPSTEYDGVISGSYNALLNVEFHPAVVPTFSHYGLIISGDHNLLYGSYLHDYGSPDAIQNPSGNGGFMLAVYGLAANNNVIWSNHFSRGGHDCSLCKAGCNHNRWLNNIMDGGWGSAWQVVGGAASAHNLFEGNVVKDVGQLVAFYKPSVQLSYGYNTVRRNVSMNCASSDLEISALNNGDTTASVLVYNNTFYSPMSCIFQSHAGGVGAYDNDLYANNICYKVRGAASDIYLANKTNRIEYNDILFMDATGQLQPDESIVIWNHDAAGSYQYPVTLADADAKYNPPFGHNKGLDVDPQFVDEAKGDFTLQPGSSLIGAGMSITDPDWGSTVGRVDLGAFGIQMKARAQANSVQPAVRLPR